MALKTSEFVDPHRNCVLLFKFTYLRFEIVKKVLSVLFILFQLSVLKTFIILHVQDENHTRHNLTQQAANEMLPKKKGDKRKHFQPTESVVG